MDQHVVAVIAFIAIFAVPLPTDTLADLPTDPLANPLLDLMEFIAPIVYLVYCGQGD